MKNSVLNYLLLRRDRAALHEVVYQAVQQQAAADVEGSIAVEGEPGGAPMGRVKARRGHMTLLPAGAAYQFHADRPSVILMQTIGGRDTVYKWTEIIQTS